MHRQNKFYGELCKEFSCNTSYLIAFFMMGKGLGKKKFKELVKKRIVKCHCNLGDGVLVEGLKKIFEEYGFGKLVLLKYSSRNKEFTFAIRKSHFRNGGRTTCYALRGIMAGYFEEATKKYTGVEETLCTNLGNKSCKFRVRIIGK